VNEEVGADVLDLHRGYGVEVYCRDVVAQGLDGIGGEFDVITSFDSIEHWHRSPKRLFREVLARLAEGGAFLLGAPNCVNLRKRITVPLGYGKWSSMDAWYEEETFRGHVREPDVADLKYIAADMGLVDIRVFGRNWLGCDHSRRSVRTVARLLDWPLRAVPSLCSDIYVVGRKPARPKQAAGAPTVATDKHLQKSAGPK
jgi:SAM-dependent methyltransferase